MVIGKTDFRLLTDPRSVAVVGASDRAGSYGWRVLHILHAYGRRDRSIFAVNPSRAGGNVQGLPAYASLRDLPEPPECTLVISPPAGVPQVLADMAAVGSRAGVILSAPHGSGHDAARRFDREIAELAAEHGLCLLGPNSMGLISPVARFAGTFGSGMLSNDADGDPAPAGKVAMLSQSGAAISYLLEEHRGRGVGYSHLISTGNEAVLDFNDLLEVLVDDPSTGAVVLFVEAVKDGQRTRRAIAAARAQGKPVVLMKIGNSDAGRAAAQSHSGRLAGGDAAYDALAADLGIIRVHGYQHLFDTVRMLSVLPPAPPPARGPRRAAVVTNSGGAAVVAIDTLRDRGWTVPTLPAAVRKQLDEALGGSGHDNPLDLLNLWRDEWRLPNTLRILADSGELDAVVVALGGGGPAAARVCQLAGEQAARLDIPVVFAGLGLRQEARAALDHSGSIFIADLAGAVRCLAELMPAEAADPDDSVGHIGAASSASAPVGGTPLPAEPKLLSGTAVPAGALLRRLAAAGIAVAPSQLLGMADDPADTAAALGYPVVLKLEHPDLLHKSDLGGVEVDLRSAEEVRMAHQRLAGVATRTGLLGAQVVVQPMVTGVEVLVGARYDLTFGHVLLIGLGGTLTELVADVRTTLLPADEPQLRAALLGHRRLMSLLRGHRGRTPVDFDSVVRQVHLLAGWIHREGDRLLEFDANPLTVNASGAQIVDARAVYRSEESS